MVLLKKINEKGVEFRKATKFLNFCAGYVTEGHCDTFVPARIVI